MRTITKVGLTAGVAVGTAAFLIGSTLGSAEHYRMVDQLVTDGLDGWGDKELKVHGFVVSGSLVEDTVGQETRRTFVLEKNGRRVRIFNRGPKPDAFADHSEIVATGHLVPAAQVRPIADALHVRADAEQAWVVDATDLMAKCPGHYGAEPNTQPINRTPAQRPKFSRSEE
jgi:cytochrome c-type biogenesis protein CcmE